MNIKSQFNGVNGHRFVEHTTCNIADLEMQKGDPLLFVTRQQPLSDKDEYRVVLWRERGMFHAAIVRLNRPVTVNIYRCPSDIETAIENIIDIIDDKMDEMGFVPPSRLDHGVRGH